jgi:23S rRNA pseudouridine1911/1915/1917 synthase
MPDNGAFIINVSETDSGMRLDALVAANIDQCSRSFAAQLIRKEIIRVHDTIKKPGYRVHPGDRIHGYLPLPEPVAFSAEPIPLDIIYEDDDIIVINKSAGMVVHPAPGHYTGTLVNGLLHHCPDLKQMNGELRPGIVHRLDKDTSGVLVATKNHDALLNLADQFQSKTVEKIYLALAYGDVPDETGEINLPIGRHPSDRKRMSVNSRKPRSAETHWQVRERFDGLTLLELNIKTGRTHQIRVHCTAIHHPVVGDPVYGSRKAGKHLVKQTKIYALIKAASRQMLHARQLRITHPVSGESLSFKAPLPEDMTRLLDGLRSVEL